MTATPTNPKEIELLGQILRLRHPSVRLIAAGLGIPAKQACAWTEKWTKRWGYDWGVNPLAGWFPGERKPEIWRWVDRARREALDRILARANDRGPDQLPP